MKRIVHLLAGALTGAALASCGGGSGSLAEGGIGGTGISSGSISAFGSIVVNGTRFDVDGASIRVNGSAAMQDDLEVGYVVRVDGDLDDGVADSVRFDADLIGEVDHNSITTPTDTGTLTVMQQTVRITATTIIEGVSSLDRISDSPPRDRVLVSGFRNSSGELVATYLEVLVGAGIDQIVGTVTASSSTNFAIGSLDIDWSDPPDSGERVLVRGDYNPATPGFDADSVAEVEDLAVAGIEIELEGIVANFVNRFSFSVDGVPIDARGAMIVDEAGADASGQIDNDVEVEVEGTFSSGGVLVADRVEVEFEENVKIVARVENDPGPADPVMFFIQGGMPRVVVEVTDQTRLRDKSSAELDRFAVEDLAQNDWVELDAFEDGSGGITALQIERFDPSEDCPSTSPDQEASLEGPVDEIIGPDIRILDVWFDTSMASIEDDNVAISLDDISVDDIVEVTWVDTCSLDNPQMVDEVELEEDLTPP